VRKIIQISGACFGGGAISVRLPFDVARFGLSYKLSAVRTGTLPIPLVITRKQQCSASEDAEHIVS